MKKIFLLGILLSGANVAFALGNGSDRTPDSPLEITAFASSPAEVMPLLFLQKQHPERFKIDFRFFVVLDERSNAFLRPESEGDVKKMLKILYAQRHYPDKFYAYAQCLRHDPLDASCGPLLGIDFSKFDPKDPELSSVVKESAAEAKKLEVDDPMPAVFIGGKPFHGGLLLGSLLPRLNAFLPPERRIAGVSVQETVTEKLYAVSLPDGIGARDKHWENRFLHDNPELEIVPLSSESREGKDFIAKTAIPALPAYFFGPELKKRPAELKKILGKNLAKEQNGFYVAGREDSGTRLLVGHPALPKTLTLFVMSQCPYGVQAENAVLDSLKKKKLPQDFKLNVRYIVEPDPAKKGVWQSLHGPAEAAEDARQIVIQKYFSDQFAAYLEARNKDVHLEQWGEAARKAGIDPKQVSERLEEGTKLLAEDYKETSTLNVGSSPTFLWENRYLLASGSELKNFIGVDPTDLKDAPAAKTPGGSCQ